MPSSVPVIQSITTPAVASLIARATLTGENTINDAGRVLREARYSYRGHLTQRCCHDLIKNALHVTSNGHETHCTLIDSPTEQATVTIAKTPSSLTALVTVIVRSESAT